LSKLIFYCEDDESINALIGETLNKASFEKESFLEPISFLDRIKNRLPNLIILDLMLPKMSGFEVLEKLKENKDTKDIPVIILSAKSEESDIVKGLDMGASDYITKPFGINEFISRIKANLRKVDSFENKVLEVGDFKLSLSNLKFFYKDLEIPIRVKEFELLKYLMENKGKVITRQELFKEVWGISCELETRTIDVHITSLRKKILKYTNDSYIETVRGIGYLIKE